MKTWGIDWRQRTGGSLRSEPVSEVYTSPPGPVATWMIPTRAQIAGWWAADAQAKSRSHSGSRKLGNKNDRMSRIMHVSVPKPINR